MNDAAGDRAVNRQEITRLLRERNARQTDLARALGTRDSAVSDLLRGKRRIRDRELPVFASFLGIETDAALRLLGIGTQETGTPTEVLAKTALYEAPSKPPSHPAQARPQLVGPEEAGTVASLPPESRAIALRQLVRPSAFRSSNRADRA